MTLKVINLFAGPSAGKTTTALAIAAELKRRRLNVAYVPEFPLELVQQQRWLALDDQFYVFGNQAHRLYSVRDDFEWAVTDGPLFMQVHYIEQGLKRFTGDRNEKYLKLTFQDLVMQTHDMYQNYNYFIERGDRKFLQAGRVQNEEESKMIDIKMLELAANLDLEWCTVQSPEAVIQDLETRGLL